MLKLPTSRLRACTSQQTPTHNSTVLPHPSSLWPSTAPPPPEKAPPKPKQQSPAHRDPPLRSTPTPATPPSPRQALKLNYSAQLTQNYKPHLIISYLLGSLFHAHLLQSKKDSMEWQEQGSQPIEFYDQNSVSNSFHKAQLQEYKDFKRPQHNLQAIESGTQDVCLMGIDVTSSIKPFIDENGKKTLRPIIKIYAVNAEGNSFLVHVNNFVPYFYVPFPRGLVNTPQNLNDFRLAINKLFRDVEESKHKKEYFDTKLLNEEAITFLEPVRRINIRGYTPKERENDMLYLKIHTITPSVVAPLRNFFQKEMRVANINLPRQTFESNIPYALRFMVDKGLGGMGWFKINTGQYTVRSNKESSCQVQLDCSESAIRELKCDGEWAKLAPLRVLSFDIECAAQHGFPSADRDSIIQIACVCKTLAAKEDDQYRAVLVLRGCSPISGVDVKQTDDEKVLLQQFEKLIFSYDPDFIIGYNIINFDLSYILDRAVRLGIKGYGRFGRSIGSLSKIKKGTLQSKIMGNRETKDINIQGRIQLDLLIHMHRQHKLSSYSLNNVSYHFLRDQKEDVHHSEIFKLFEQGRDTRRRLAIYCLKDAELPLKLMEKLCCLYNYSEMARVTGVPMNFLLNRGQQIKVVSQLLRKSKEKGFILPTMRSGKSSDEKGFEGAYVLDPEVGYYTEPIATLDFASLYPSIMMAHNLCYTTLVNANQLEELGLTKEDVTRTPQNYYFVTNLEKRQGLLPEILTQLIAARKKAKKELANAKDDMTKNVLQGRQLALKISANSVYGFTGATVGQLPCLQISSSVTAFGREMIDKTRNRVKELFPGAEVIYGDTDSVMVKFKLDRSFHMERSQQILETMEMGRKAAGLISMDFKAPIKLEFQKVYCPYLLMAKKRYVGVYYSSSHERFDKIDKKGFQSVRRDNCYLIREMLENILDLLLCKNDTEGIATYVKKVISNLVQNKIDMSKLVITKAISKNTEEEEEEKDGKPSAKSGKNTYKVKQAHVELAQKMQKRDENISLNIGDRISYVMIAGQKGSKNYENAEDPIRVLEQDLPVDFDYYIQKQIRPPLQRLLLKTNIFPNLQVLFAGEHTKNRYVPKINKNNLMGRFVTVFNSCINCPTKSEKALCERCNGKALEIQVAKLLEFQGFKAEYKDLWNQCVNCQGSVTMDVLCSNVDCPIYYRRIKVRKDMAAVRSQMDKLNAHTVDF